MLEVIAKNCYYKLIKKVQPANNNLLGCSKIIEWSQIIFFITGVIFIQNRCIPFRVNMFLGPKRSEMKVSRLIDIKITPLGSITKFWVRCLVRSAARELAHSAKLTKCVNEVMIMYEKILLDLPIRWHDCNFSLHLTDQYW